MDDEVLGQKKPTATRFCKKDFVALIDVHYKIFNFKHQNVFNVLEVSQNSFNFGIFWKLSNSLSEKPVKFELLPAICSFLVHVSIFFGNNRLALLDQDVNKQLTTCRCLFKIVSPGFFPVVFSICYFCATVDGKYRNAVGPLVTNFAQFQRCTGTEFWSELLELLFCFSVGVGLVPAGFLLHLHEEIL